MKKTKTEKTNKIITFIINLLTAFKNIFLRSSPLSPLEKPKGEKLDNNQSGDPQGNRQNPDQSKFMQEIKSVYSVEESARMLNVSKDTISKAIKLKNIKAIPMKKRGHFKIPIEEIKKFMKKKDEPTNIVSILKDKEL